MGSVVSDLHFFSGSRIHRGRAAVKGVGVMCSRTFRFKSHCRATQGRWEDEAEQCPEPEDLPVEMSECVLARWDAAAAAGRPVLLTLEQNSPPGARSRGPGVLFCP